MFHTMWKDCCVSVTMSNINVIVTNLNDVHRILDSFERKKRGYDEIVYPKKYKTPVTKRSDYLVQNDHPLTLEGFLEERNKLVMRLDENSRKRLMETRHPPQFYPTYLYGLGENSTAQSRQLQFPNDVRSPERGQQQQQKKQPQQQQYQPQQQQYQPQPYTQPTIHESSSPDLFRGLMNDIGDIDESLTT
jgi:hypothetical protein